MAMAAPAWRLDHAAVLVRSIENSAALLSGLLGADMPSANEIEEFEGEGTRELYLGDFDKQSGLLLLMQALDPAGEAPYARALAKRGPGLHHLGMHVSDLAGMVGEAADLSGWSSVGVLDRHAEFCRGCKKTEWLFCRGVPTLLEVSQASGDSVGASPIVTTVELPVAAGLEPALQLCAPLLSSCAVDDDRGAPAAAPHTQVRLTIAGHQIRVSDFCG